MKTVAQGINSLGVALYRAHAATAAGDFTLSPASISAAFALAYAGARGDTRDALERTFRFVPPDAQLLDAHARLLGGRKGCTLISANALWRDASLEVRADYAALIRDAANAELHETNFSAPEVSRRRINAWVAGQTNQMVDEVLPQGSVTRLTRSVLTNVMHFNGTWASKFDPQNTTPAPFTLHSGKIVPVEMMFQREFFQYGELPRAKILAVPYACRTLSMVFILPDARDGLKELENTLSRALLETKLHPQQVGLHLPKFEVAASLPLADLLMSKLGLKLPFTDAADFSGIADKPPPLFITGAFHTASVKVDEVGTEAAAATGMVLGSRGAMPTRNVEFRLNRPFLFAIRDDRSGALLFIGRVLDPR